MEHALLIVGKNLTLNNKLMDYLSRIYIEHFGELKNIYFSTKTNKELPFTIEKLSKQYKTLTIAGSKENFSIISKIIATLNEDNLELSNEVLAPSRSSKRSKNSFTISFQGHKINVIQVAENDYIPNILSPSKNKLFYFSLIGLDEDSCKILLKPLANTFEVKLVVTSMIEGWLMIQVISNKFGKAEGFIEGVQNLFSDRIIMGKDPIKFIIDTLIKNKKTITVAESCTGGLVASIITSYSGASEIFIGSLVTYSNLTKKSWLKVDEDILSTRGAVSEECVRQMLQGALTLTNANYSIAISGIAGPNGGTSSKPVGTVYVGVANKDIMLIDKLLLKGDRKYIQDQSAMHSFFMLLKLDQDFFSKNKE